MGVQANPDGQPAPRRTIAEYLRRRWATILVYAAAALFILGVPPGVPSFGSLEIEFDKSSYIVGDIVHANIYLSNVHPWPIRVPTHNKFEISREFNGEPYGPTDGAFLNWGWTRSIYIPPYSRVVIHDFYRFKVSESGEYTVVIVLSTGNKGSESVMVYS